MENLDRENICQILDSLKEKFDSSWFWEHDYFKKLLTKYHEGECDRYIKIIDSIEEFYFKKYILYDEFGSLIMKLDGLDNQMREWRRNKSQLKYLSDCKTQNKKFQENTYYLIDTYFFDGAEKFYS
jgi:hypothetical protein